MTTKTEYTREGKVWCWTVTGSIGEIIGSGYCRTKREAMHDAGVFIRTEDGIKIGRDFFPCSSVEEAIGCWVSARDQQCLGASEAPSVTLLWEGQRYRVSYNGRIWKSDGSEADFLSS